MGNEQAVWNAIDALKKNQEDYSLRLALCERAVHDFIEQHKDLCIQLKEYDVKMSGKMDFLIGEYHKGLGAKNLAAWLPTLVSVIVGAIAIYTFVVKV